MAEVPIVYTNNPIRPCHLNIPWVENILANPVQIWKITIVKHPNPQMLWLDVEISDFPLSYLFWMIA